MGHWNPFVQAFYRKNFFSNKIFSKEKSTRFALTPCGIGNGTGTFAITPKTLLDSWFIATSL